MCLPPFLSRFLSTIPLWPFLLGLLSGIFIADLYDFHYWVPITLTSAITLTLKRSIITTITLGFILGFSSHGYTVKQQEKYSANLMGGHHRKQITLTGTVIDTGSKQSGPYLLQVSRPHHIRVLLKAPSNKYPVFQHGDLLTIHGTLQPVPELRNPHGFDQKQWLHRRGVELTLSTYRPIKKSGVKLTQRPNRLFARWRKSIRSKITQGLHNDSQEAQLIRAVVLGERPPRNSSITEDFKKSGTLHVFAVSGLHVGMVGTLLAFTLWMIRVPRWALIIGTILGMLLYAGITGFRPSAVRALIMAAIFLTGFLLKRKPYLLNTLAASAIMVLLLDGHQLFTPGFQLSYGVLLMLALTSDFWMTQLKPIAKIDPFLPRCLLTPMQERILNIKKWLRNALAFSVAAWSGSAPLIWLHFGIITPIAILAGIPLMLLVFLILAIAMLGLALGVLSPHPQTTMNQANALVAQLTSKTAAAFANIPLGHWYHSPSRPTKGQIIVYDIPYGGGAHFIDVGNGFLLDCGSPNHFTYQVLPSLNYLRAHPNTLIISHADVNHCGGMSSCLDTFSPQNAIIPHKNALSPSYNQFIKKAQESHCQLIVPHQKQTFPIEKNVFWEVLQAPAEMEGNGVADDSGLVMRLHWHGWKILFTGDAGFETEQRLLDTNTDIQADVIIMGRHSSDFTGSYTFYKTISPKAIISTNCTYHQSERIPPRWFKITQSLGITVFDQQKTGALTLTIQNNALTITPFLKTEKSFTIHQ